MLQTQCHLKERKSLVVREVPQVDVGMATLAATRKSVRVALTVPLITRILKSLKEQKDKLMGVMKIQSKILLRPLQSLILTRIETREAVVAPLSTVRKMAI